MRAVFIHTYPKSRKDLLLLQKADLIVSVLPANVLLKHLNAKQMSSLVICNEEEIYATNLKAKTKWNTKLCDVLKLRPETVYTNAGAARSEFSSAIEAFSLWLLLKERLKFYDCSVSIISENKDLQSLAHFETRENISQLRLFVVSIIHCSYRNIRDLWLDIIFFVFLKSLREPARFRTGKMLTFSLLKHWSQDHDWRYGEEFSASYKDRYILAALRCGGLQRHNLFSWFKLARSCVIDHRCLVIEKYCSWLVFFKLVGSATKYKLDLICSFSRLVFKKQHSPQQALDYLLILEQNRYASNYLSNSLVYFGAAEIFRIVKPKKVLNYHFEFPVGRAIAKASANQVSKIVNYGLQHGPISRGKWCYELSGMMFKDPILKNYCPTIYLLEGEYAAWIIGKYVNKSQIKLVGAARQDLITFPSCKSSFKNSENAATLSDFSAVYLMDLHSTGLMVLEHITKIVMAMPLLKKLVVRPHPRDRNVESKLNLINMTFPNQNITISSAPLQKELLNFKGLCVWGESTGALLDCVGFGLAVKVIRPPGKVILDPLIDFEYYANDIKLFCESNSENSNTPLPQSLFEILFHQRGVNSSSNIFSVTSTMGEV